MGDKTKVIITKVPSFPDDPVKQEAIQRLVKDAWGARRMRAKGSDAAAAPRRKKAREEEDIIRKIADNLKRRGIHITAKSVLRNWPKDSKPPPKSTFYRRLSKIIPTP
jgi:hypothetical protein